MEEVSISQPTSMRRLLLLVPALLTGLVAAAQCTTTFNAQNGISPVTGADCTLRSTTGISPYEAITFSVQAGSEYTVSINDVNWNNEDVSVFNNGSGTFIGGSSGGAGASFTWTSTFTGTVRAVASRNCITSGSYGWFGGMSSATLQYRRESSDDPSVFGSDEWRVYAYDGRNRDNLASLDYEGFYTETGLSYNSATRWSSGAGSPSDASGYQGCPVGIDNHTVVSKRQGFPCGVYEVDVAQHDDEAKVLVNGTQVWAETCCDVNMNDIYVGYLGATSTIEMVHAEGGGGSDQGLNFTLLSTPESDLEVAAPQAVVCPGDADGEVSVRGGLYIDETFSSVPPTLTTYQNATVTGGRLQLTPNVGNLQGFGVFENVSGHDATSFRAAFTITDVGADGYFFGYGDDLLNQVPTTGNINVEEGVLNASGGGVGLSVGLDIFANRVYLKYDGNANILVNQPYAFPVGSMDVVFEVDDAARASLTINGSPVFTDVVITGPYYQASKTGWDFAFGGRTGGVSGLHTIDDLFIGEYEYRANGGAWQTDTLFAGLAAGPVDVERRPLLTPVCGSSTAQPVGSAEVFEDFVSATVDVIDPSCVLNPNGILELTPQAAVFGRVVRIVQRDNEPLNTSEIEVVLADGTNVALAANGGEAQQSSTLAPYTADALNNGNTFESVGAHTNTGVGQWQQIVLDQLYPIEEVRVWNRQGCCQERLNVVRMEIYADQALTQVRYSRNVNANTSGTNSGTLGSPSGYVEPLAFPRMHDPIAPSENGLIIDWSAAGPVPSSVEDQFDRLADINPYEVTLTTPAGCEATVTNLNLTEPNFNLTADITDNACPSGTDGAIDLTANDAATTALPNAFTGLEIWLAADKGVERNANDEVAIWDDLSGNNNDFRVTYGDGVQWVASGIGGQPSVRFDGSNLMEAESPVNDDFTVIVVGQMIGTDNERLVSSGNRNWLLGWHTGGERDEFFSEGWVNDLTTTAGINDAYIYTGTGDITADVFEFFRNGTQLASNGGGSAGPGILSLGGWGQQIPANVASAQLSDGDIAELIVYDRVLTTRERQALEAYLSVKYGIAGPAPLAVDYQWSNSATTEDLTNLTIGSYTVTATDAAGCELIEFYDVDQILPTDIVTATGVSTGDCIVDQDNQWVDILDADQDVLVSINDQNQDLGLVSVTLNNAGSSQSVSSSGACAAFDFFYMGRQYTITTTVAPTGPVGVRLYFTSGELSAHIAASTAASAPGCTDNDDVNGLADLVVTKYATGSSAGDPGGELIVPVATGTDYGGTYVEFTTTSFSEFFLHGSESGAPLPVELLRFTATAQDDLIRLDWATASELDNAGFEVQRSMDGIDFTAIGWVDGNGTTSDLSTYRFDDETAEVNIRQYYRLKQVDTDGTFEYSPVESAILGGSNGPALTLRPNPVTGDELYIDLTSETEGLAMVRVFDVRGQQVLETQAEVRIGANVLELGIDELAAGMYTVVVEQDGERQTRRFVVSR